MKKLTINYKKGTVGKEFFRNEKEAKWRMEELDGFGVKYVLEDATYEEMIAEHRKEAEMYKEENERIERMTQEEYFSFLLGKKA